ncbi:MAG: hypothetical protein SW019_13880 [Actinomycetota bacterium]|nr:hypothetical protein [Actinomycetota bacterium]
MKRVTRDVDPAEAGDLLARVPRACAAFAGDGEPRVEPVTVVLTEDRCLVGIPVGAAAPEADAEVVLLVDEGAQFFELRAVYLRGHARPAEAPPCPPDGLRWFSIEPTRTAAWDYGRMRYVDDET